MKVMNKQLKNIILEETAKIVSEMYAGPAGTKWEPIDAASIKKKLIDMHLTLADPIGGSLYELFDKEEVLSRLKPIQINLQELIQLLEDSPETPEGDRRDSF